MNLLPEEFKKELQYEAWRRFLVSFGMYLVVVGVVANLLLLPSYFFLSFQIDAKKARLGVTRENPEYKDFEASDKQISSINFLLRTVSALERENAPIMPTIKSIVSNAREGVGLRSLSYTRKADGLKSIQLIGVAALRQNAFDLEKALRADPYVSYVDAPVTNFIPDQLADFTFTLDLKR